MEIIHDISRMQARASAWLSAGLSVGLVPTMGYLHEGHMSLVRKAVLDNDRVVVSIFVNPIQFGANEDLDRYPRDMARDVDLCDRAGVDVVFSPSASAMYPDGFCSHVDLSGVTIGLCGANRPGYFRGVCTVVMKLFHIVNPNRAYFGQKDAQQLATVKRMVNDFNMRLDIVGLPTVREPDGLAMSSRNAYLDHSERAAAQCLYKALSGALRLFRQGTGDARQIKQYVEKILADVPSAKAEYVEIVDTETMQPVETLDRPALCAVAVFIGRTRLIDNIQLSFE
jgi:pantoate--beta-alanine ligase